MHSIRYQRWLHQFSRWGLILFVIGFFSQSLFLTHAIDPVEDLENQKNEIQHMLDMSLNATKPLEGQVADLSKRITNAQKTIAQLNAEQKAKAAEIAQKEADLAGQYKLFANRVDRQYRQAVTFSPLVVLLNELQALQYQSVLKYILVAAQRDRDIMESIGGNIADLQKQKVAAALRAQQLAGLQAELDKQKAFFEKEIAGAKKYQSELQGKIASLTARQQQILAEKTGTAQTSVGDIPLVGDPNARPDFNPGFSPAFALFSFGAPHFKGMSQYGAFGRAKSGQNAETILKAYYGDISVQKTDMPGSIRVDGVGTIAFEDRYLKGIAEMPARWADDGGYEALKAQAIAARTYALSYVGWHFNDHNVKSGICATESCQVYNNGKANDPGRWGDAVRDTAGMVVVSNGTHDIFATWFASTSGGHQISYTSRGHTTPGLWDTTSSWSNWVSGAYEKVSASPWFYMGWYKSRSGDSCGRNHPWLNQEEFADILNAWVVRKNGSGDDVGRIAPYGPCWGGNPWSIGEMRDKANGMGGAFTSVSSVRVQHSQDGFTSQVIVQTNRGEVSINGNEFKEVFNLRAPGRIAIKGKLFGIERK